MLLPDLREDFPLLTRTVRNGKPLVYLDSGATAQKPRVVLDAEREFYEQHNAAVQRGAHLLAEEATELFEGARGDVASLVGAQSQEIVWAENATAAVNLVASGIGNASAGIGGDEAARFKIGPGDEICVTETEHHANLVPWQALATRTGATLRWIPVDDQGRMILDDLDSLVNERTRVLAFTHVSNVTGLISPVGALVARAKAVGALTVLDGCQSVPHLPVDVKALDIDFMAMSAHKMLGPTGIGALYGRKELLDALPPSIFGGGAVKVVTMEETSWQEAPMRFEAGSQPVAQAVGMGAAARYLAGVGMDRVEAHEREIAAVMRAGVAEIPGVRLLGPVGSADARDVIGVASIAVDGVHPHDVGQVLDDAGIAVRVGHHCAQPLHRKFGVTGSTRASAHVYTTREDAEAFVAAVATVPAFFGVN
ncbi:SufS family cysteine desulfurase [Demequina sp. B12]|uniref:aminotransferase class V-fold PLP-dependent enzyme n=1 Tax=Demequina sp. B12 TaxID=2992757 RepID=UPI00237BA74A|nr:SufS family cysteine desulfurase [Demequina sp. B12]MDE0573235.1 SufS family cysteine desulfurase [Demequina sp. B12]